MTGVIFCLALSVLVRSIMCLPNQEIACGIPRKNITGLIRSGQFADVQHYPWHAVLFYWNGSDWEYLCGGTLINDRFVLTARHCTMEGGFGNQVEPSELLLTMGLQHLNQNNTHSKSNSVSAIYTVEDREMVDFQNDIALIKLSEIVKFTDYILPACLVSRDVVVYKTGKVVGFGINENDTISNTLRMLRVPVVHPLKCIRTHQEFAARINEKQFCAGHITGRRVVCNGDSGGGLLFKRDGTMQLGGIVSFLATRGRFDNRCKENGYAVYTNVFTYLPWIEQTIRDKSSSNTEQCELVKGQCVDVNRKALQPQDGRWSRWSSFNECSRRCGTGVQISTRDCDSPPPTKGGKYCIGMRMRYQKCNTHDCLNGTLDFREEQCQELNGNNFDIPGVEKSVQWVPKYGLEGDDRCKLYCRVRNSIYYYLLKDKVKDGTSCGHPHESYDMCINEYCRKASCDNVFDSDAIVDKCSVCWGSNDTCSDVNGAFPYSKLHDLKKPFAFLQKIVRIPRGATNIVLIQRGYKEDGNYLALRDDNNEYLFNPPMIPINKGFMKRFFAGVMLDYNGPDEPIETIQSDFGRPLKQDLIVEIFSHKKMRPVSDNIVEYSYSFPIEQHS